MGRAGRRSAGGALTDWDGASYRRVNTLQQWLARRALDDVDLRGVTGLLDIGCGDGRVTRSLAQRIPEARCVGIDPSPGMIAVAPACGRLTFQVGAAETMTFVDEFDLVVSFNALHWVRDQAEALTRIATALRAQGRAVLVLVCGGPRPSLEDVATTVTGSPRWLSSFGGFAPPFVHPDPLAWQHVAALAGFAVDEVRVDDLSWDFGTREAFTAWCAVGFSGWTHRLSDEDGPTFVEQVVDAYAETAGSDHVFRFMQLVGRLTKPS